MEFSKVFRPLIDISRNLISVKFSGFSKSVESSISLRHKVDTSGSLWLINYSGFPRF